MDLCERSDQRPEERVSWRWWEQDDLYLEEEKKRAVAEEESDGGETLGEEEGMPLETTTSRE